MLRPLASAAWAHPSASPGRPVHSPPGRAPGLPLPPPGFPKVSGLGGLGGRSGGFGGLRWGWRWGWLLQQLLSVTWDRGRVRPGWAGGGGPAGRPRGACSARTHPPVRGCFPRTPPHTEHPAASPSKKGAGGRRGRLKSPGAVPRAGLCSLSDWGPHHSRENGTPSCSPLLCGEGTLPVC